jgi:hypothetical protein
MSGVGSLLSFVVYGDEVKNITGELCGKNASSTQVIFVRIFVHPPRPPFLSRTVTLLFAIIFLEDIM